MEESEEKEGVNEAHPNEGEIEEAVQDVDLTDSPEDATDDDSEESSEANN